MNILLAEDDANFGLVLKTELEEDSYVVDLVANGVEAILNFLTKTYGLVLLDIKMPRLNGNDTLKIIKKMDPHMAVITFSGNAGSHEIAESIKCGAAQCLTKPFEISQLRCAIKNCILQ